MMKHSIFGLLSLSMMLACDPRDAPLEETAVNDDFGDDVGTPRCHEGGGVRVQWSLSLPEPDAPAGEGEVTEISVACTVGEALTDPTQGYTLALLCSAGEDAAGRDAPYTLQMSVAPEGLVLPAEVLLSYRRWSGSEVGSSRSLSLATADGTRLGLYAEQADGVVGLCQPPHGSLLTMANSWLQAFDAGLEPSDCADASILRLTRDVGGVTYLAHPGESATMGGVSAVLGAAQCLVRPGGQAEAWSFAVALWRF